MSAPSTNTHGPRGETPDPEALLSEEHRRRLLAPGHGDGDPMAASPDLSLLKRAVPFLAPHWGWVLAALVMIPVTIMASLQQPLATKKVVDGIVASDRAGWRAGLALYAGAILVQFLGTFVQTYALQLSGQRAMAALRAKVFEHAQRLRIGYFDRTPVGRILTRVTNDVDALGELFSSGAIMAVADLIMLVGIVFYMVRLDLRLSLVAFAAVPPLTYIVERIRRRARLAFRDIRARVAQLNGHLSEQVQGMQVVQAFGREEMSGAEYALINDLYRRANHRAIRYDAMLYSVVEGISSICIAAVLWYGSVRAGLIEDDAASAAYLGTIAAFYQYIQQFFVPIRDLSTKYTLIQSALAAAERVFSFLDIDETVPDAPPKNPTLHMESDPLIRFDQVRFGYRPDEEVLHGVSFDVRRGEHVAVVGATGAGKTSTIAVLQRFYEISGGSVCVGGVDVCAMSQHALRERMALVPQDVFLFAGTVAENVAMGESMDRGRVEDALRRVSAFDLLQPRGGIDARVEERGNNFSAGERQLIAFARALYRDAEILILDEATANIDSETEARVQTAIEHLVEGRTAIVIAHRLSTIRKADRILVFHRGEIVEQGTHDALLEQGEIYAHLHHLQFAAE